MKPTILALLSLALGTAPSQSQEPEKEELQFLIIETISKNPELASELMLMKAARDRVSQAGSLDDPQIILKAMEIPGTSLGGATYQNIEFMQMVMFPTKLFTRREIAEVQAEHAHHNHLEKEISVLAQLKKDHAMLWYARTALALNRENELLLDQIVRIAQAQYSVGRSSQQDVLKAGIELAKVRAEEAALQQQTVAAESMLRAALNRPSSSPIGTVELDSLTEERHQVTLLIKYALSNRPMLVHDSLSIRESSLMLSMAKQEYIPDFKFSVEYVRMPVVKENRWSVMVGLSIPFAPWTLAKASGRVEEAQAMQSMRRWMYLSSRNMIEAKIRESFAAVQSLTVKVRAYQNEIVPKSWQSLQASLTEYQTGRTSYLMLIDGYRMYKETRMEAAMARMQYEQAVATLEQQVGVIDLSIIPLKEERQ